MLYTLVCTYRVVPEVRCGGNQVPTNMTSGLADGVRRKFSQLGGKQITAERSTVRSIYLMACKRKKNWMDVERACRQICLGVSGWSFVVPCLARHRLPGTWAVLGLKRQNQGALNPLELGEGSTDSKLLQRRVHWKGSLKKKMRWRTRKVVGRGTRRGHAICMARAGHR